MQHEVRVLQVKIVSERTSRVGMRVYRPKGRVIRVS